MRYLLCLLFSFATAASAQVASGQWLFQKRNANGTYAPYGLSWSNGQAVRLSGGVPSTFTPFDGAFSSLTGTLSLAQVPDALLTIAKTSGLQTALDGKQSTTGTLSLDGFASITGDLEIANVNGLQAALDAAGATAAVVLTANEALDANTVYIFAADDNYSHALPAAPADGDTITLLQSESAWGGVLTIARNGNAINGAAADLTYFPPGFGRGVLRLVWLEAASTWIASTVYDSTLNAALFSGISHTHAIGSITGLGTAVAASLANAMTAGTIIGSNDTGTVTSTMVADGTLVNADISGSAAIALSKLATDPLARANHTGTQTLSTISDAGALAALNAVTTATITDGTIVDADISGSAAIAISKLASSSITIAGAATSLGDTISLDTITGLSTTGLVKRTGANTLAVSTLDANVETWIGTPSKANLNAAVSDDDPAYVGTANTFTAAQTVTAGTNSTTPATGVTLQNTTSAISGTQSASPRFILTGQGYKTGGTPGSQALDWSIYNLPVQGAASDISLMFSYRVAGGSWNDQMRLAATGQVNYRGLAFAQAFSLIPSLSSNAAKFDIGTASFAYDSSSATKFSVNAGSTTVSVPSGWNYGWTSSSTAAGTNDTSITRVSAGVVGVPAVRIGASGTAISQSTVTTTALDTSTIAALSVREDTFTVSEATTTTPFSFTFSAAQNDDLHVILMRSDAGHIYVKWYNSNAVTARAPAGNITIRTWVP